MRTSGYNGKNIKKTAIINSNDPENPEAKLTISGYVEKFVDINPKYVRLTGYSGDNIAVPVSILPSEKYPFKIIDVKSRGGAFIQFNLTEKKPNGYTLLIENTKKGQGRYSDVVTLTTDSDIQAEIRIHVYGNIMVKEPSKTGS